MLADRIRRRAPARHVGRDTAVVDDAPALRVLFAHQAKSRARRDERAHDVHIQQVANVRDLQLIQRRTAQRYARVVEQRVQPPPALCRLAKRRVHRVFVGHVTGQHQRTAVACGVLQCGHTAPHQPHVPARVDKGPGRGASHAAAGTGDDNGWHGLSPVLRNACRKLSTWYTICKKNAQQRQHR